MHECPVNCKHIACQPSISEVRLSLKPQAILQSNSVTFLKKRLYAEQLSHSQSSLSIEARALLAME